MISFYPIIGHEKYKVSQCGLFLSFHKNSSGRVIKQHPNRKGYLKVRLGGKTFLSHRIIAITFIDNPNNLPFINHKDGDKKNNHFVNLEWCTNQENATHAKVNGLLRPRIGSKHGMSKISEVDVCEIRRLKSIGITHVNLAKQFGIGKSMVGYIVNKQNWKHV